MNREEFNELCYQIESELDNEISGIFNFDYSDVGLDGWFTSRELRIIADRMDELKEASRTLIPYAKELEADEDK